jgi:SAM-dependent methyltransferase
VLEVLAAAGFAVREAEGFAPTEDLAFAVGRDAGMGARGLVLHVAEFLRSGSPLVRMDGAGDEREREYRDVVPRLASMFDDAASELAGRLAPHGHRLLDVGTGSGVWSLAFAQVDPDLHVVGADFPAVLEAFTARARALGLSERVTTCPGDAYESALGSGHDRVMIANVLHLESPERARALVDRAAQALAPDGELVLIDAFDADEISLPRRRGLATYHLSLAQRTDEGGLHHIADAQKWCRAAGLPITRVIEIDCFPVLQALVASH